VGSNPTPSASKLFSFCPGPTSCNWSVDIESVGRRAGTGQALCSDNAELISSVHSADQFKWGRVKEPSPGRSSDGSFLFTRLE
jgi:hypothetical protein